MAITDGNIHYALDDAYIHMAISKNIVNNHIYGVSPHNQAFASSSPIWTILLSLIFIFNQSESIPMILNFILSYFVIIFSYLISKEIGCSNKKSILTSTIVIILMPMIPIVFGGMDHLLHIVLYLSLILYFLKSIKNEKLNTALYISAILAGGTRLETIFIIIPMCIYLLQQNKIKKAIYLFILSTLIFNLHGLYTLYEGSYFLPTSIVAKSGVIDIIKSEGIINAINYGFIKNAQKAPILSTILLIILIIIYISNKKLLPILLFSNIILHMLIAGIGWFYRYEAYMIVVSLILMIKYIDKTKILSILIIITLLYMCYISVWAHFTTPLGVKNVFEQQYQMGLFTKAYYNNKTIVLNDLGGISYFSDSNIIDITGLANIDMINAKKINNKNTKYIDEYTIKNNATIAIVYDDYLLPYGGIPKRWQKIAEWNITWVITVGDEYVVFYSLNSTETPHLLNNLKDFEKKLPKDVKVKYFY